MPRRRPRMTFRQRVRRIGLPWWAFLAIAAVMAFQARRLIDPVPGSDDVVWGVAATICAVLSVAAALVARSEPNREPEPTDER